MDLSRKQLKKVPKQEDAQNVRVLKLDENELQKIDNIDSYLKIEVVSANISKKIKNKINNKHTILNISAFT